MNRPSFVYHTPIFQSLLGFLDGLCWLLHLREKCPHTEVFLVRIFPYSVRIRENTDQKKLRFWTLFTQYILLLKERRSLNPCQHIKAINYCCQVLYRRCFAVVLVNLSMRWTSQEDEGTLSFSDVPGFISFSGIFRSNNFLILKYFLGPN